MHIIKLPAEYMAVLRQVAKNGRADTVNLTETLLLDSSRLLHIVQALKHKGLIKVSRSAQDTWISLSARGRRLSGLLWPETKVRYGL